MVALTTDIEKILDLAYGWHPTNSMPFLRHCVVVCTLDGKIETLTRAIETSCVEFSADGQKKPFQIPEQSDTSLVSHNVPR